MHPIITAIEQDDFTTFVDIITKDPISLNQKDQDGWNLLPLAIQYGMPEFRDVLLEHMTMEMIETSEPLHPFMVAINNKSSESAVAVMKNSKVNPDSLFKNKETALHYAFFLGDDTLATALIERGADPFIKNNQGISPFTLTIQKNKQEAFDTFINRDNFEEHFEIDWIKNSIKYNNRYMFEELYPYFDGNIDDLFKVAIGFQNIEIVVSIINTGDFMPGKQQVTDIVELMCKQYSNPVEIEAALEIADFLFSIKTPFQDFVNQKGQSAWMLAIEHDNEPIFERLIQETHDSVNTVDSDSHTPLVYAIVKNKPQFVAKLLERNANPNHVDHNKDTPLLKAVRRGNTEIVKELLKYPVLVNELNSVNENALSLAIHMKRMDLVEALIWAGGEITTNPAKFIENNDVYHISASGAYEKLLTNTETKEINNFRALVQLGFNLNTTNEKGNTLLVHFIKEGYLANFHALLKCMINGNQNDSDGNSALMCGMKKNADDYSIAMLLKISDLDLTVINNQGQNVYDVCIESRSGKRLETLLNYDPNLTPDNALKSLFAITEYGNLEAVWNKFQNVIPNLENKKNKDGNSLIMLATKGANADNLNFLLNQPKIKFSSQETNNSGQSLADLVKSLEPEPLGNFTEILSQYISSRKKKKL